MKKFNVVLFAMSSYKEWARGVRNRNYFIVQNLLRHFALHRILLVNYLSPTFKRSLRVAHENLFFSEGLKVKRGIFSSIYQPFETMRVLSTIKNYTAPKEFSAEVAAEAREFLGALPLLVWSYYPLSISYFSFPFGVLENQKVLKIFDAVDNWMAHPAYLQKRHILQKNYEYIEKHCDVIFTVSKNLKTGLFPHARNAHVVPNGVDFAFFKKVPVGERSSFLKGIKRPIAGYVGTIESRIDVDLVNFLAERNPKISFVFAGPIWKSAEVDRLRGRRNVHFIGRIAYEHIPALMREFSVGIIPHRHTALTASMDPMKAYEYLACGIPVIATPVPLPKNLARWIQIAGPTLEFNALLGELIKQKSPRLQNKAELERVLALSDWKYRVDDMLDYIQKSALLDKK